MAVQYNKLWKLLVDRKMSKADLRRAGLKEIAAGCVFAGSNIIRHVL